MLAFKIMDDPFVGTITFAVFTPVKPKGTALIELDQGQERAHRAYVAHACERPRRIKEAYSGDIVALAG